MQQKSEDHWRPLGFFSRKLTDTEYRYSTFDRELLAAHAAIKHFRQMSSPIFVLSKPNNHWISRRGGGRPSGLQRDGRQAKPLSRNAAFTGRHIPQIGFPPDRPSTPGWKCFHRQFLPNCSPQIQKKPAGVWPASGARSTATHACSHSPSPSLNGVFLTYLWIWWAHCSTVIILIIFLLLLIIRPSA